MTAQKHPARIFATVNGASTRLPDGARQLVGGWCEDRDRPRALEYVRADIANVMLATLYEVEEYFDNRADADHDETGFVPNEEMKLLTAVRAAIAKATGQ